MKPEYIFIVGSFRSGTTLVRNILDSSDEIAICWETHFLGHFVTSGYLNEIRKAGNLSHDDNAIKAVEYMFNFDKGFWHWFRRNVDKAMFTRRLLETDRSDRAIFDLLMQSYARGKPIKGEKTPSHLYYLPTLLKWFPNSKIIHTFRDPRAIFVSELRKKNRPESTSVRHARLKKVGLMDLFVLFQVTLTWLRATFLHNKYQAKYPDRYFMIKLEDILLNPESHLQRMGEFLNVELPPEVLDLVRSNSSFTSTRGKPGLDTAAADRWRSYASPWVYNWFEFWFRKRLREFGYQ